LKKRALSGLSKRKGRPTDTEEIDSLIRYHQAGLFQYQQYMSPAAAYLERQTIKALEELREAKEREGDEV